MISGTGAAQLLPILLIPVISRLYTPDELGQYAVFLSLYVVLISVATGRYEYAILLPKLKKHAREVFSLGVTISFSTSVLAFLVIAAFRVQINVFFNLPADVYWLYLVPFSAFFYATFLCTSYLLNRDERYTSIAIGKASQSSIMGSSQVGFGFLSLGSVGLIWGKVLGDVISTLYLWHQSKSIRKAEAYGINPNRLAVLAGKYQNFPKYNAPHSFVNTLSNNLPIFAFSRFFGDTLTGLYSMAHKATYMPVQLIASAFAQVFSRKISEIYRDKEDVYAFFKKVVGYLAGFAILPFGILMIFGPQLFGFILGEEWFMSGVVVRYLAPWMYLTFVVSPLAFIPMMLNEQKKAMIIEVIYFLLRLLALAVGIFYLDFMLAVTLFVLSGVLVISYQLFWIRSIILNKT